MGLVQKTLQITALDQCEKHDTLCPYKISMVSLLLQALQES